MANQMANVNVRIDQGIKEQAEAILAKVGVSASALVNMTYRQVIFHRGIPFSVTIPVRPKTRSEMTNEEFNEMMDIGLAQAKAGDAIPADIAFDDLLKGL